MKPERTFYFFGAPFGTGPLDVRAEFAGRQVYNGGIDPVGDLEDSKRNRNYFNQRVLLWTAELPIDQIGVLPLKIRASGGLLMFGNVESNYTRSRDPQHLYLDPGDFHVSINGTKDSKYNVVVDGQPRATPAGQGEWYWHISRDFTCDIIYPENQHLEFPKIMADFLNLGAKDPFPLSFN